MCIVMGKHRLQISVHPQLCASLVPIFSLCISLLFTFSGCLQWVITPWYQLFVCCWVAPSFQVVVFFGAVSADLLIRRLYSAVGESSPWAGLGFYPVSTLLKHLLTPGGNSALPSHVSSRGGNC